MSATARNILPFLLVLASSACTAQTQSSPQQQGVSPKHASSHLVFQDDHEDGVYGDNWYAYPLDGYALGNSFLVTREGKSGDFAAMMSLDCKNSLTSWEWGVMWGSELVEQSFFSEEIPEGVLVSLAQKYCK